MFLYPTFPFKNCQMFIRHEILSHSTSLFCCVKQIEADEQATVGRGPSWTILAFVISP